MHTHFFQEYGKDAEWVGRQTLKQLLVYLTREDTQSYGSLKASMDAYRRKHG